MLDAVIGYGQRWEEALEDVEWDDGDVLVVGSSSTAARGPGVPGLAMPPRSCGNSPVPVVVVPGRTVAEITAAGGGLLLEAELADLGLASPPAAG